MRLVRLKVGFLLAISMLLFTAAVGMCAEHNIDQQHIDQQIAERAKQYRESLRQRAAQVSPAFQEKIETQTRKTVVKGLTQWKRGEIDVQIALPRWAASQRIARFVARHLPGVPAGSLIQRAGDCVAGLNVPPFQFIPKSPALCAATCEPSRFVVTPFKQGGEGISYFVQIVRTVVLRS